MTVDLSGANIDAHYKIIEKIGEGAASNVYKAQHLVMLQIVAVKILKKDLLTSETAIERFKREALLASRLQHPHIVRVLGYGISREQEPFIVMLFNDGITLDKTLAQGALDAGTTVKLALQLLSALAYAHQSNIIHRDIKPANILQLKNTGTLGVSAMLLDFGLAKELLLENIENPNLTQSAFLLGTPNYMSPEQCLKQTLDARSDIYSFGCVLFECLTGRTPFSAESSLHVMDMHVNQKACFKSNDRVSPQLQKIVLRCLSKIADERYQSATELAAALESIPAPMLSSKSGMPVLLILSILCGCVLIIAAAFNFVPKHSLALILSSAKEKKPKASVKHLGGIDPDELRERARIAKTARPTAPPDYVEAISNYRQAIAAFRKQQDELPLAVTELELGELLRDIGQATESPALLADAAKIFENLVAKTPDEIQFRQYLSFTRLAQARLSFYYLKDVDATWKYYDKAMKSTSSDDVLSKMNIRRNGAMIYLAQNDLAGAEKALAENISDFNKVKAPDDELQGELLQTKMTQLRIMLRKHQFDHVRNSIPGLLEENSKYKHPYFSDCIEMYKEAVTAKQYDIAQQIIDLVGAGLHKDNDDYKQLRDHLRGYQLELARLRKNERASNH